MCPPSFETPAPEPAAAAAPVAASAPAAAAVAAPAVKVESAPLAAPTSDVSAQASSSDAASSTAAPSAEEAARAAQLSAFLSPTSRFLTRPIAAASNAEHAVIDGVVAAADAIAHKVASMLRPGPPFYSTLSSADLIDTLGDAARMNCASAVLYAPQPSAQRGRGTVWSALNALPSGPSAELIPHDARARSAREALTDVLHEEEEDDDGLWSGVTISCDLQGGNLCLGKSVVVPSHVLAAAHYYEGDAQSLWTEQVGKGKTYQWDEFDRQAAAASSSRGLVYYVTPTVSFWSLPSWVPYFGSPAPSPTPQPPAPRPGRKRVWLPSPTAFSIHATWWGYQLYLPPPIMAALDKDMASAEKIAITVHTMLLAIIDKASTIPMPPQLVAVLSVLRTLAPLTGYIATFIGWSWSVVKQNDEGKGVILAATWLLPIALIPRAWDAPLAPEDTDGDGKPDGPPTELPSTPVPGQPAEPTPAPTQPGTKQPDAPVATPAPAPTPAPEPTPTPAPTTPAPTPAPSTGTEQPVTQQPVPQQPDAKQPSTQPVTEQPSTEQPSTEQPDAKQPETQQPISQPSAPSPSPSPTPAEPAQPAEPVKAADPIAAPTPAVIAPSAPDVPLPAFAGPLPSAASAPAAAVAAAAPAAAPAAAAPAAFSTPAPASVVAAPSAAAAPAAPAAAAAVAAPSMPSTPSKRSAALGIVAPGASPKITARSSSSSASVSVRTRQASAAGSVGSKVAMAPATSA